MWYQQRGLEPSAAEGPYSVALDVADARRVLDALGWRQAYVVGHSWGGHLALHVAVAMPERLLGVLAVDPLGSVGDGRWPEFDEEILRRTPESVRERAREIDERTDGRRGRRGAGARGDASRLVRVLRRSGAGAADARAAHRDRALGRDGALDPRRASGAAGGAAEDSRPRRLRARLPKPDAARRFDRRGPADSRRVGRGRGGCWALHVGRGSWCRSGSASAPYGPVTRRAVRGPAVAGPRGSRKASPAPTSSRCSCRSRGTCSTSPS